MPYVFGTIPLLVAASSGKVEQVKNLLLAGADVKVLGDYNRPVLYYVFDEEWDRSNNSDKEVDYLSTAKELIKAGADVNAKDDSGRTPLMYAMRKNNLVGIELLIASGADVNAVDKNGQSVLHQIYYREESTAKIFEIILKANANPNLKDNDGKTPLMMSGDHPDLAKILIQNGAHVDKDLIINKSALLYRGFFADKSLAESLINSTNFNLKDSRCKTLLMDAIRDNKLEIIKLILSQSKSLKNELPTILWQPDEEGQNALMIAVKGDNVQAATLLIDHVKEIIGAEIVPLLNQKDKNGEGILFQTKSEAMFNLLVETGAEVNEITPKRETPLTYALNHQFYHAAMLLLDKRISLKVIDVKTQGRSVWTLDIDTNALCEAVRKANPEERPEYVRINRDIAIRLMEKGADPSIPFRGETIFQFCRNPDIRSYLQYRAGKISRPSFVDEIIKGNSKDIDETKLRAVNK